MDGQSMYNGSITSLEEWNFEKIDADEAFDWFKENFNVAFHLCLLYVAFIFVGQYYMESRPRFDLRKPLLCWSGLLAVFSIIGSIRTSITFQIMYKESGARGLVCSKEFYIRPVGKFWAMLFCISKAPELVDTVFIVLRKQKLIFLHWYHHITVLLFSWHCYKDQNAGGAIFMVMNFIVHSMMYSYYACRAARIRVPKLIALTITTCQILQMFLGMCTFYFIYQWRNDGDCPATDQHLWYGGLMYTSYFVLFCHFFYNAYLKPPSSSGAKDEVKKEHTLVHPVGDMERLKGRSTNTSESRRRKPVAKAS